LFRGILILTAAAMPFSATARAETLEDIEKQVESKWADVKSLTARIQADTKAPPDGPGVRQVVSKEGTLQYVNHDGKVKLREEFNYVAVIKTPGSPDQTSRSMRATLYDGASIYAIQNMFDMYLAQKYRFEQKPVGAGGKAMISALRHEGKVTVGEEQDVDGQACWTLLVELKTPGPVVTREQHVLRKKDGLRVRIDQLNKNGQVVDSNRYTDFKLNEPIDPKVFEFKPPADAIVKDKTNKP
jgi:outer membrane lipoprotein-sorting protein